MSWSHSSKAWRGFQKLGTANRAPAFKRQGKEKKKALGRDFPAIVNSILGNTETIKAFTNVQNRRIWVTASADSARTELVRLNLSSVMR